MTKADIVDRVSERVGFDKCDVLMIVDEFMGSVTKALAEGESVFLRGFGTFGVKLRGAKKGRDLHSGSNETIEVPAMHRPFCKFSPVVKDRVKELKEKSNG